MSEGVEKKAAVEAELPHGLWRCAQAGCGGVLELVGEADMPGDEAWKCVRCRKGTVIVENVCGMAGVEGEVNP